MTRNEAKQDLYYGIQFDTLKIDKFIDKIYDRFDYRVNRLLESLENRQDDFADDEFYQNLLLDIENIKSK